MQQEGGPSTQRRARLSIRQALALALALTTASAVLGTAGVLGHQLRRACQRAERLRVVALAEAYAAQVAGAIGSSPDQGMPAGSQPAGSQGVQALVQTWNWHPGSRLLAVLDRDGAPVVVRGDKAVLEQVLKPENMAAQAGGEAACLLPGDRELFLPEVAAAVTPIVLPGADRPVGTLVYATRTSGWSASWSGRIWKCLGAVLAVSGAGFLIGLCLLRHSLLEPLRLLVRAGRGQAQPGSLPAGGPDEIGALAQLLVDMNGGLDRWRERVTHLEASVERRVQTETHEVTLKLRQVERKAWMDPLTRLGNRRLLDEKFAEVFAGQREAGEDLALVMLDVDHFKNLNDTLGHKAGDELIGFIGELLRQCVREDDLAIRYGGDEFLLVLPGATAVTAAAAAERIIRLFGQRARLLPVDLKPSMSAGVVSLREHRPAAPAVFLQMADKALYRAKSLGKSQVYVYRTGRATAGAACPC